MSCLKFGTCFILDQVISPFLMAVYTTKNVVFYSWIPFNDWDISANYYSVPVIIHD